MPLATSHLETAETASKASVVYIQPKEVWTVRGLVTFYTVFVIELQSRRVQVVGATRYPDEAFVTQP